MEQTTYNANKKYFSGLGLRLFISTLLIYGVQLLSIAIFGAIGKKVPSVASNVNLQFLITMLPMYIIAYPIILFLMKKMPAGKPIEQKKMTFPQMLVAFLMLLSGTYICNFIGTIFTTIIGIFKQDAVSNVMVDLTTTLHPAVTFFIMVICAPIAEELFFRKALTDKTIPYGEGVSVLLSGLLFALFHGNLNQFVYAFFMGCFMGFLYLKTGRIIYTIILHMVINFFGSVVSSLLMNHSGINELNIAMANGATQEELTNLMTTHAVGMAAFFVYAICLVLLIIAGFVLFIVNRKKFKLGAGEITLEKGQRFKTLFCNIGMGLFCIFWIVMIIIQLLQ